MDVEVIDMEEGKMVHCAIEDDEDTEPNDSGEANTAGNSTGHDEDGDAEPHVGMEFASVDIGKSFYDEYARRVGFSTRVGQYNRSKSDGLVTAREFLCARDGLKRRAGDSCDAMLRIEFKGQDKWVVTKFEKEHSHSTVSPSKVHYLRPRRHFAGAANNTAETYQGVGVVPSGVMYVSMDGNRLSAETSRGARNTPVELNHPVKNFGSANNAARPVSQKRTLGKDAQNLLDYFKKMQAENPGFYYAIQLDEDNRMSNVFWADAREAIKYAEEGAVAPETFNVAMVALREGGKKVAAAKKNVAKVAPPSSQVSGIGYDDKRAATDMAPLLWPRQDEITRHFNLNDASVPAQPVTDLNLPRMAPVSLHRDDGHPDNMVVLPCLKSMTWVMENKNSTPANRVAVINLKLQDFSKATSGESEVKFQLSRVTLEPMLRSMAYISEQLSTPANRVAVINLKDELENTLLQIKISKIKTCNSGGFYLGLYKLPN
ncbi:FAR1-related sequence 3 [Actinidia rufa]|uniref:Protein FAR1-RELATED SEQUENCE n=1 Tax=Actinidia rufa TaxID=165716 RepID=A0A7J0H522_9ERIC|nr:FAR1-related sequence 3 [Actinidia rufa]